MIQYYTRDYNRSSLGYLKKKKIDKVFPHIQKDNNVNWLDRRLLAICTREPLNINRKWFFILKINFKHFVSHKLHIDVALSALIKVIKKSVLLP